MKNIIYQFFYIWILFCKIDTINGKDYIIKNNDEDLYNLVNLLDNINSLDDNETLELKFVDSIYDIDKFNLSDFLFINVCRNITFIGNSNGTIFDFSKRKQSAFHLEKETNNEIYSFIKFENIIFENHISDFYSIFNSTMNESQYQLIIDNCIFRNSNKIFLLEYNFNKPALNEHFIISDTIFQ